MNNNKQDNDSKDNISVKRKKQPSKAGNIVKMIFFVIMKIFSYLLNIILTVLLIGIITGGIVVGAFFLYVNEFDDSIDQLEVMASEADLTTTIYYYEYDDPVTKTNPRLEELEKLHGSENRTWVKYQDIEKSYLIEAFLALEDQEFWSHDGINWRRTLFATFNFLYPMESLKGGSTITQQLVKLMTGDDDVRPQRKIQEILRAMKLESQSSKEEIIETYLNTVNMSSRAYGVQAAAYTFFSKDVTELNLIECAALASIVQSPTAMNPIRRPENNKRRRDECLKSMLSLGWITQEEFDEAFDKELVINQPENTNVLGFAPKSYYVDQIITDVISDLMEQFNLPEAIASKLIYSGGLQIYSCMARDVQNIMDKVYGVCYCLDEDECIANGHDPYSSIYFPKQSDGSILFQSSMVVIDPNNGDLLGIVGGRGRKVQRGLNRATGSQRQPGSSIKPVSVYAPALEMGRINYGTPLYDYPPMTLNGSLWPTNYGGGYSKTNVTLKNAIEVSKNTTSARVLQMITPEYSFSFMHDLLNVRSLVDREVKTDGTVLTDIAVSPLALGGLTYGVSVCELTAAYQIFANKGVYTKPRTYTVVKDQYGNTILDNTGAERQRVVISEENAYIMTKLLWGVVNNKGGTAYGLPMAANIDVAGKTGTTNDEKDRWFIGFTPYYLCGSWFGYDQPKYLGVGVGLENPPLKLFYSVMDEIHSKRGLYNDPKTFEDSKPPTIIEAPFCKASGKKPIEGCYTEMGYYARGAEPHEPCDVHKPPEEEDETEEPTKPTEPEVPETTGPTVETTASPPVWVVTTEPTTEYIPPTTPEPITEEPTTEEPTEPPFVEIPTEPEEPATEFTDNYPDVTENNNNTDNIDNTDNTDYTEDYGGGYIIED